MQKKKFSETLRNLLMSLVLFLILVLDLNQNKGVTLNSLLFYHTFSNYILSNLPHKLFSEVFYIFLSLHFFSYWNLLLYLFGVLGPNSNVCGGVDKLKESSYMTSNNSWTLAGCPTIQLNFNSVYPEIASVLLVKHSALQECLFPYFRHQASV